MQTPKVSVTSPSIRPEALKIVAESLSRQDFTDFEWLVGSPANLEEEIEKAIGGIVPFVFVPEPPKREGSFYNLNACWNELFRHAKGELVVNIVDGLWFQPDTLSTLWYHFEENPKRCITLTGDQYDESLSVLLWKDPRGTLNTNGSFYETYSTEMELCIASLPKQAIIDCKGLQEVYDQGCAMSEKTMCLRMEKLGYKMFIDKSIPYRAIRHGRIGGDEEWNKHYKIACDLWDKHSRSIMRGEDLLGDL